MERTIVLVCEGVAVNAAVSAVDRPHATGDGTPFRACPGLALGSDRSVRSGLQGQA
jgi:hypothetical protein